MQSNPNREPSNWHAALLRETGKRSCCRTCCALARGRRSVRNGNAKRATLRTHRIGK